VSLIGALPNFRQFGLEFAPSEFATLAMNFLGFALRNNLFVAPMAGVTGPPFRQLCKRLGAGMAVSEMVTSNSLLYGSAKTGGAPTTKARRHRSPCR